jgi:hypothetical protein
MIAAGYDKVYTVTDYYDGPRAGVADFNGQPHYYECQFDDVQSNWSDIFLLKRIDSETFQLALEDWEIWEHWNVAREEGRVSLDTHPALPEERERHNEISIILQSKLKSEPEKDIKAKAAFEVVEPKRKGQSIADLQVKWSVVP